MTKRTQGLVILFLTAFFAPLEGQNPHEGPFTGTGLSLLMESVCSVEIANQTQQNILSGHLNFFENTEELIAIEETDDPSPILISKGDHMPVHDSTGFLYQIGTIYLDHDFADYLGLLERSNEDYILSLALKRMCFLRKPPAVMIASRGNEGRWLADVTNAFKIIWR